MDIHFHEPLREALAQAVRVDDQDLQVAATREGVGNRVGPTDQADPRRIRQLFDKGLGGGVILDGLQGLAGTGSGVTGRKHVGAQPYQMARCRLASEHAAAGGHESMRIVGEAGERDSGFTHGQTLIDACGSGHIAQALDGVHLAEASHDDQPIPAARRRDLPNRRQDALASRSVASSPAPDVSLDPLQGDPRPLQDWVTTFHLVLVVVDPFTYESAWLVDTAGRILQAFAGADCRPAWLVTGNDDQAREFLGPWADEMLTFTDPDRAVVRSMGLESLPALVHLDQSLNIAGLAEGWHPDAWQDTAVNLADVMSWSFPRIPSAGDPAAYDGTPALG